MKLVDNTLPVLPSEPASGVSQYTTLLPVTHSSPMNIVVFGASGATGLQVVSQALQSGHVVTAFVRNPAKLSFRHERLKIIQGDVSNFEQVAEAVQHQQGVISALGVSKTLQHDPVVVQGIQHIIKAMEQARVTRLVYQSTFGVRQYRSDLSFVVRRVLPLILHKEFVDHELKEDLIRKSSLDYIIVRPGVLSNGPLTGKFRHGERILPHALVPSISRADVASFMIR